MIHIYWHTEPDERLRARADLWRRFNDADVTVWTPNTVPDIVTQAKAVIGNVVERDHVRYIASIVRWTLLSAHGGMWADADVTPRKPFTAYPGFGSLLDASAPWSAALGAVPTPFVCGGPAGHPLWQRILDEALDEPYGSNPGASGGGLLARVVTPFELTLIPANLFAATDADGHALAPVAGGRFCDHDWATSARRHQGDRR